jgi:hypothetical protein
MQSLISVPSDPTAIAEILASLIRADRRSGAAEPIAPKVRYGRDPKGVDFWANPRELNAAGRGDCAQLVRAAAQYVEPAGNVWIVVARTAAGFHTWISLRKVHPLNPTKYDETHIDPSVDRGMPKPPSSLYASGAAVQLWPNGKQAVKEGSIAEEHPQSPADYLRAALRRVEAGTPPQKRRELALGHLKEWSARATSDKDKRDIAALLAVLSDKQQEVDAIKRKLAARDDSPAAAALIEAAKAIKEELPTHGVVLPLIFAAASPAPSSPAAPDPVDDMSDEEMQALLAAMIPGCPGSCDAT